ncbi:contact-dependent growth inhibition system immunity protein, partial [Listeria monocytogenes]
QKIKDIYHIDDSFSSDNEKYNKWLKSLLNKTKDEITEKDVYTMLLQQELEDLAIEKAIEFIKIDPLTGEMWDGQFLEQLAGISADKLVAYKEELQKLIPYIDIQIKEPLWDFEFEREDFISRYMKFKDKVANL